MCTVGTLLCMQCGTGNTRVFGTFNLLEMKNYACIVQCALILKFTLFVACHLHSLGLYVNVFFFVFFFLFRVFFFFFSFSSLVEFVLMITVSIVFIYSIKHTNKIFKKLNVHVHVCITQSSQKLYLLFSFSFLIFSFCLFGGGLLSSYLHYGILIPPFSRPIIYGLKSKCFIVWNA